MSSVGEAGDLAQRAETVLRTHASAANGTSKGESNSVFARLAPELLVEIAAHMPVHSRTSLPLVCRRWVDILSSNVAAWKVLDFEERADVTSALLERLLRRSGSAPVQVLQLSLSNIVILHSRTNNSDILSAIVDVLTRHMNRMSVIELIDIPVLSLEAAKVDLVFQSPAPILHRAVLTVKSLVGISIPHRGSLFTREGAPKLRELILRNYNPCATPAQDSALHNVTHLSVTTRMHEVRILALMTVFPRIRDVFVGDFPPSPKVAFPPEIAARLSIRIHYFYDRTSVTNLVCLSHAYLRRVSIGQASAGALPVFFQALDDGDAELSIRPSLMYGPMPENSMIRLELGLPGNRQRVVESMEPASWRQELTILADRGVFRNVRKLTVSRVEVLMQSSFTIAGRLHVIAIRPRNPITVPSASTPNIMSTLFPKLEEFDLTYPPASRATSMPSCVILEDRNIRTLFLQARRISLRAQPRETYDMSWGSFCAAFLLAGHTPADERHLYKVERLELHRIRIDFGDAGPPTSGDERQLYECCTVYD
ncbi:hypothetical protein EXIGLDRAFT_755389 [Exidia glandulosa HHB12029]|uniref:F-box domain-containing protein n=1 Tax=Exidia glandulosa HHB12029 TaxID=1314781 RepID=A0A165C3Q4_EXIGL|nr:hypothetical protein EXIGLDRAFT_755389 [Exidia glandulosa HHB12029]